MTRVTRVDRLKQIGAIAFLCVICAPALYFTAEVVYYLWRELLGAAVFVGLLALLGALFGALIGSSLKD